MFAAGEWFEMGCLTLWNDSMAGLLCQYITEFE
jgi:hypothetical protein